MQAEITTRVSEKWGRGALSSHQDPLILGSKWETVPRYSPEPVPDFEDDTQELRRYLFQELDRISEAVNQKTDRAYAGIFQGAATIIISPLTPVQILFDVFSEVTPEQPDGVEGIPADGSLTVLSGGAFNMSFSVSIGNIPPNAEYEFELAVNGVGTGRGGEVEPSNQTDAVLVGVSILINAQKGDIFTILISSATSSDAEIDGSEFSMSRVSEEQ